MPITAGSPVKRQRRWSVLALCVVLAVVGALGASAAVTSAGNRVNVLALAKDVPAGQKLTDDDLVVAAVSSDPALDPVKSADKTTVVGQRVAVDLRRGQMLTRSDLSAGGGLGDDQQAVGVAIKRGQAPDGLAPGDKVLAVATAGDGQKVTDSTGSPIQATVMTVGQPDATGTVVITLAVAPTDGPTLAARAAVGQVALVRQPRNGS
ncbi:SAF domain-containing protein [Streptomyces sp. NPDC020096]